MGMLNGNVSGMDEITGEMVREERWLDGGVGLETM